MSFSISNLQRQQLDQIAKKHGIEFMVLFGSYANREQKEKSDLDIALMFKRNQETDLFGSLYDEIREVLKKSFVGKSIELDLRLLNGAEAFFLAEVGKTGQFLAGDEHAFDEFQVYTFRLYLDDVKKLAEAAEAVSRRNLRSIS